MNSQCTAFLTHDRLGFDNTSLRLSLGPYRVPPGVYFYGPITTSVCTRMYKIN